MAKKRSKSTPALEIRLVLTTDEYSGAWKKAQRQTVADVSVIDRAVASAANKVALRFFSINAAARLTERAFKGLVRTAEQLEKEGRADEAMAVFDALSGRREDHLPAPIALATAQQMMDQCDVGYAMTRLAKAWGEMETNLARAVLGTTTMTVVMGALSDGLDVANRALVGWKASFELVLATWDAGVGKIKRGVGVLLATSGGPLSNLGRDLITAGDTEISDAGAAAQRAVERMRLDNIREIVRRGHSIARDAVAKSKSRLPDKITRKSFMEMRADFLGDIRREKWRRYLPPSSRFSFAVPSGLVRVQEVPAEGKEGVMNRSRYIFCVVIENDFQ